MLQSENLVLKPPSQEDYETLRNIRPCDEYYLMVGEDPRARYAVGIYNKEHWNKGYGRQITQTVVNYAFHSLNLHRVDLRVLAYNKRAIAVYENIGFVQEGVLRENAFINNEWHDDIIMSILAHEFHVS